MFGLGTPELIVILVILFFLFGASRLPELGKGVGEAIRNFKKGITAPGDAEAAPKRHGEHEHGRHD